jgi:DNA-binding NarL/FixJ family response regulator
MGGPITVLIAEALPLIRRGLVAALSEDPEIEIVGILEDGLAAVEAAKRLHPRVVLMGSQLQHVDGIQGTRLIKSELPDVNVLVIGTSEEDSVIFSAIEAGAIGYVLQDITPEDLREAMHSVCNGMTMVHPRVMRKMVHRLTLLSQKMGSGRAAGLTSRELEVLLSMSSGRTDKEIAGQLAVTEATVKSHIRTVFHKTGTVNRAQAVATAMRVGLIR